jgi:hypothetical protein
MNFLLATLVTIILFCVGITYTFYEPFMMGCIATVVLLFSIVMGKKTIELGFVPYAISGILSAIILVLSIVLWIVEYKSVVEPVSFLYGGA